MTNQLAMSNTVEAVVIGGDLSKLTPDQRVNYYKAVCTSLDLNPLTRPFDYITLNGKLTLYARKDATEQLRRIHGVSIEKPEIQFQDEWIIVTVTGYDMTGRKDSDVGVVNKKDMRGDFGNALMKAVTKAKRRLTLSICGLGMLDETEIETIPDAKVAVIDDTPRMTTAQAAEDLGFPPELPNITIPENLRITDDEVQVMKPVKKATTPPPPDNFLPEAQSPVKEKVTFCELHMVEMPKHEKDGKSWYSHKTDTGAWCNGKPKLATQA